MAARIVEIVAARGKMHNPETDSGGVLLGHRRRGRRAATLDRPRSASAIVTLASLTLTPLRLDEVTDLDPASPQVEVDGHRLRLRARRLGAAARRPAARGRARGLRRLRRRVAHARPGPGDGTVLRARRRPRGQARAGRRPRRVARGDAGRGRRRRRRGRAASTSSASATSASPPTCAIRSRRSRRCAAAGAPPADLTVVVVNATGCEAAAILLTADARHGPLLLDGDELLGRRAGRGRDRLGRADVVGSGYAPDRGAYALELVRRLRAAARGARRSRRGAGVSAQRPPRCRCAGATSTRSGTSTTPSSSPTSRRAATRSCTSTGSAATSTSSAAAR